MVKKFSVVVISCQNKEIDFDHMSVLSSLLLMNDFKNTFVWDF